MVDHLLHMTNLFLLSMLILHNYMCKSYTSLFVCIVIDMYNGPVAFYKIKFCIVLH